MGFARLSALHLLLALSLVTAGCAPSFSPSTVGLASQISKQVGCTSLKADLWSEIYQIAYQDSGFPSGDEFETKLNESLLERLNDSNTKLSDEKKRSLEDLSHRIAGLYQKIVSTAQDQSDTSVREKIKTLAQLELGDQSTPERAMVQKLVKSDLPEVLLVANEAGFNCSPPQNTPDPSQKQPEPLSEGPMLDTWNNDRNKLVYGAWKSMAIAYQSCDAVTMEPLSDRTPDALGVVVTKKNPQNGGNWREITHLDTFIKTNPYYAGYREPDVSCNDIRKKPLIYDYGGKPAHNTQTPYVLDLFSQNGTGSSELGIDCSGLVLSAYFTAGLRLSTAAPNRPMLFDAIPAANFKDPLGYNTKFPLDCVSYVSVQPDDVIRPGDVLASSGHIVIIDEVGTDPFGVSNILKKSDCKLQNIDPSRFNFTIVHSSPVKGALGISRLHASAYFKTGDMTAALEYYGVAACKAQFGETSTPKPSGASLVRHSGQAKCMDQSMAIKNTSCLKSCRAPAAQSIF